MRALPRPFHFRCWLALALLPAALAAQTMPLAPGTVQASPVIVTAARMMEPPENAAVTVRTFDEESLHDLPAATLDGALRTLPAFSLFRRSDSLTANPTAQGVSLRGLGPSGASRSLVLLDGVPLNDPFGGWVDWTQVPRDGLRSVEIVPGGGATAWGNAALGGVVQVLTRPLARGRPEATFKLGDFGTRSLETGAAEGIGNGALEVRGRIFSTDGFALVAPERRGPIDIPAWSRHRWLQGRWTQPLLDYVWLTVTARDYEEFRGNGTPYTRNGTREKFASVALAAATRHEFTWTATAYAQDQSFASTFSSVNAARTAETPASDQFAVPATALGAAWTGEWRAAQNAQTSAGVDMRHVRGETRENFSFSSGNFTRQRIAGGEQSFAGVFILHERPLAAGLRATAGLRLDGWRDTDGHRHETDRITGAVLRDDHYGSQHGAEFSPSAGLVWQPDKNWRIHASGQQAFRRPTLNELYRPFRQGTTVVETNPALRTEHVISGEVGAEWTRFAAPSDVPGDADPGHNSSEVPTPTSFPTPPPSKLLTLGATAFANDFRDAVGNVTLARGPGTFPLFGTLPVGGVGRQRLNLDRTRVQGLEFSATWRPNRLLTLNAAASFTDAEVRRASVAPALVGNRVAQVPRHSATVGAAWQVSERVRVTSRLRWLGRQFEDDENTLVLGEAVVGDLGAAYQLRPQAEFFLNVENIGDARLETGRSADGVVNTGTPRFVTGGFRTTW